MYVTKRVMNSKVDKRIIGGRPRFGWIDGVKKAVNDRGRDIRDENECPRNKNECREILRQN